MRQKKFFPIIVAILAIMAVALVLGSTAGAQVKFKTLHAFRGGADGRAPQEGLIIDSGGNLYGTTMYGGGTGCGGQGCGTVFKLTPSPDGQWAESVLYRFTDNNGGPAAALISDTAGNLYGTTDGVQWAWGSVFKLAPNSDGSWTESTLWVPATTDDGYGSNSSLTLDGAGNLYGTTMWGGGGPPWSGGVVFRLSPNPDGSWAYSKLYVFQGNPDGRLPIHDGVILDASGNLYGQTAYGGELYPIDAGTIYMLVPNSDGTWTETVLYRFEKGMDGVNPDSNLIFGPDGSLYGTTYRGFGNGCNDPGYADGTGCGMVCRMTLQPDGSWEKTTIHGFTGRDGGNPVGRVIFDSAGNLYGTTFHGGDMTCGTENPSLGCGTVYKLTPEPDGSWSRQVLHVFHSRGGSHAVGGLVLDGAGSLYGSTQGDGVTTFGSVFEITP